MLALFNTFHLSAETIDHSIVILYKTMQLKLQFSKEIPRIPQNQEKHKESSIESVKHKNIN